MIAATDKQNKILFAILANLLYLIYRISFNIVCLNKTFQSAFQKIEKWKHRNAQKVCFFEQSSGILSSRLKMEAKSLKQESRNRNLCRNRCKCFLSTLKP